mgnify:FL=1
MWKFSKLKDDTEQHSLSYRYLWQVAFCVPVPHIYSSVGYCIVYFSLGLSTTFYLINESQLHTFFVYAHHFFWSWRIMQSCRYVYRLCDLMEEIHKVFDEFLVDF